MQRPWFRRQTWSWYVELDDGKQHNLGKHPSDAAPKKGRRGWSPPPEIERAWRILRSPAESGSAEAAGPTQDISIAELFHRFQESAIGQVGDETFDNYHHYLQDFNAKHPGLRVAAVTRELVRRWLDAEREPTWGVSSHRGAITAIKRAMNWGVEARVILNNPIAKMKKPKAQRRKKVMDAAEREDIMSRWPEGDCFRDYLVALQESGCRPSEVRSVTAANVDLAAGTWVMRGKDFEATGEMRVVYLTPTLLELTRRLVALRPKGPMFLNDRGKPWTRHAVSNRFNRKKKLKRSTPIDAGVTAYAYRHSFITDALAAGLPDRVVAELAGHRSTAMLTNYAHLHAKADMLKMAAEVAAGKGAGLPTANPANGDGTATPSGQGGSPSP